MALKVKNVVLQKSLFKRKNHENTEGFALELLFFALRTNSEFFMECVQHLTMVKQLTEPSLVFPQISSLPCLSEANVARSFRGKSVVHAIFSQD